MNYRRKIYSAALLFALASYLAVSAATFVIKDRDYRAEPEEYKAPIVPAKVDAAPSEGAVLDAVDDYGFELSPLVVPQGGFAVMTAKNVAAIDIKFSSPFDIAPVWVQSGEGLAALIPVKYTFAPGEYPITVEGGAFKEEFLLKVTDGDFPTQELTVDEEVADSTIDSKAANDEYMLRAQPVKAVSRGEILFDGAFILPVDGEVTTEFGSARTVNGKPSDRHGGIDLACERGTPVKAANSGEVLFAEYLQLTGNTVCIEHGMGLKTWYYHMDSLSVSAGDSVKKGQEIGKVGSTGFSTGPHLHFAAAVGSVYIDSAPLFSGEILPE